MKTTVFSLIVLLFFSCTSSKNEATPSDKSPFEAGGTYDQELAKELAPIKHEQDSIRKIEEANMTDIEFEVTDYDFGKIKAESKNEYFFVFKNTGDKPLVIESARASCGCTTPIKPTKPILPGKKDSIQVRFSPFPGMKGQIEKTITVKSNTFIPENKLFIHSTVE
jgi:hypothetical protein